VINQLTAGRAGSWRCSTSERQPGTRRRSGARSASTGRWQTAGDRLNAPRPSVPGRPSGTTAWREMMK